MIDIRSLGPVTRLAAAGHNLRLERLQRKLIDTAARYAAKQNKSSLRSRTIEFQLHQLEQGEFFDHFSVDQRLVNDVMDNALRLSGNTEPIIIDIGGGTSSTHVRFAEAGAVSVCIDPAVPILAKLAQVRNMVKIAEGIWKDRTLEHYLVAADAETAAEVLGIDEGHPLLRPLTARKRALLQELTGIARDFQPDRIADSEFPQALQNIANKRTAVENFENGSAEYRQAVMREQEREANRFSFDDYKSFSETEVLRHLQDSLRWARERLAGLKLSDHLEENRERIEDLIERLVETDNLIEEKRLEALRTAEEPPVDLVFCGYMPPNVDFTPAIKTLLAKGIFYVVEANDGATGIPSYENLTKSYYIWNGFYNYSFLPGTGYEEISRQDIYGEPRENAIGHTVRTFDQWIVQARRDVAPPNTSSPANSWY
ncbi:MAG: hypothetical protein JW782_06050 [Candidatus Saganbacteria bacterium]|nr:hypothetical protein [Candidatus Saganbacteria bacterium]